MDVEFAHVRIEDSLQHHDRESCRLSGGADIVQAGAVQHARFSRHGSWVDGANRTIVVRRFIISKRSRRGCGIVVAHLMIAIAGQPR